MELVLSSGSSPNNDSENLQNEIQDWTCNDHLTQMLKETCVETESYQEDEDDAQDFSDISNDLDWYTATENLMLDELSILCRNLHAKLNNFSGFEDFQDNSLYQDENVNPFVAYKKSSSSENISNLVEQETRIEGGLFTTPSSFERDCRLRRSLPIESIYFHNDQRPNSDMLYDNDRESDISSKRKSSSSMKKRYNKLFHERNNSDKTASLSVSPEIKESCDEDLPKVENKEENLKNNKTIVHLSNNLSNEADSKRINKDENRSAKKVGFSKTEIHFAPDSGKVNIVETDGKPPPTNRFRRRRRDHIKNNNNFPANRLPITHFGDTSYEKYIFGAANNPNVKKDIEQEDVTDKVGSIENPLKGDNNDCEKSISNEIDVNKDKKENVKYRGHITTINFITNDMRESMKLVQDINDTSDIDLHLRFNKDANQNSSPVPSADQDDSLVTRTTKMTVHIPFTIPEIPHLRNIPFSSLKSVRLILNLKPIIDNKKVQNLFSSFYDPTMINSNISNNCQNDEEKQIERECNNLNVNLENYPFSSGDILNLNCITSETKNVIGQQEQLGQRLNSNDASNNSSFRKNHEKQVIKDAFKLANPTNNLVAMKTIKTHKPVIAHVEKDYVFNGSKKVSKVSDYAKLYAQNSKKLLGDEKDDNINEELTYVNVFNHPHNTEDQIYENVSTGNFSQRKKKEKGTSVKNFIKSNESNTDIKNEKLTSSLLKKSKKDSKSIENKMKTAKSARISMDSKTSKNISSTVKSKKPVEIVYKTAIFNMQNESLSRPQKGKELKSSHYINDLICGKKSKHVAENRKLKNSFKKSKNNPLSL